MKKQVKLISIVALVAMLVVSLFGCKKMDSSFLKETVKTMDVKKGVESAEINIKAQGLNAMAKNALEESGMSLNPNFNLDDITLKVDSKAADDTTASGNISIKIGEEFVPLTDMVIKDNTFYVNMMSISGALAKILSEQVAPMINMVVAGFGVTAEKPYLSFSQDDISGLAEMGDMGDVPAGMPNMDEATQEKLITSIKNLINAMDAALTGAEPAVMGVEDDYYTLNVDANNVGIVIEKFAEVGVSNKADLVAFVNAISPDSLSEEDVTEVSEEETKATVEDAKKAFEEANASISSKIKTKGEGDSLKYDMEFNMNMTVEEIPVAISMKGNCDATADATVTVPTGVVTLTEAMTALQSMMGGMTDSNQSAVNPMVG